MSRNGNFLSYSELSVFFHFRGSFSFIYRKFSTITSSNATSSLFSPSRTTINVRTSPFLLNNFFLMSSVERSPLFTCKGEQKATILL